MTFDKAAYWAQKGQPRPKRRPATVAMCAVCPAICGTFERVGGQMTHVGCPGHKPGEGPRSKPQEAPGASQDLTQYKPSVTLPAGL